MSKQTGSSTNRTIGDARGSANGDARRNTTGDARGSKRTATLAEARTATLAEARPATLAEGTTGDARGKTTRRHVLAAGAGAFGYATLQAEPIRAAIPALAAYQAEGSGWTPRLLTPAQGELLATLCEHILPRTDTPGARDAAVHEFIDLELSLADGEDQLAALGGLDWIDRRSLEQHGSPFLALTGARQTALLREISDEHEEHPPQLVAGAAFFSDLKRRTLFAFYTSKVGRTEALGLPDRVRVERFRGCQHEPAERHG